MNTPSNTVRALRWVFCLAMAAVAASAPAQISWTNAGPDLLWTTPANWSTGVVPGASDPVIFTNASTTNAAGAGAVDNIIPASQSVLSLSYTISTNTGAFNFHNTLIQPGVTLTLFSGNAENTLFAGSGGDAGASQLWVTNSIFGPGGALVFNNTAGNINVRQGTGNSTVGVAGTNHSVTLDMSGLDNFTATAARLLISGDGGTGGAVSRLVGTLLLARTNVINLSGATAPQLDIGDQPSNGRANPSIGLLPSYLFLGISNSIFADTITVGRSKSPPVSMLFNPAFAGSGPSVYIRGQSATRVSTYSIGDNSVQTTSNQGTEGTNDFIAGTVDLMADTMYVGRGENGTGNAAGTGTGTLAFGSGTVDVNTLEVGYQTLSGAGSAVGVVRVNGGTLQVNTSLRLARYAGGAGVPSGTLNVNNGTVRAQSMIAGGGIANVTLSGSSLTITTNAFGSAAGGVSTFNVTNSALTLAGVLGGSSITTTNLGMGGTANTINVSSMPVITGYPTRVQLIKYTTLNGAYNAVLGTLPSASPSYKGYLTNDTGASAVTLVLTNGPATARVLTWTGVQPNPDWDQDNTANWKTNGGPATTFHDLDLVQFDNTAATNFVNLNGYPLLPSSITMTNSSKDYIFSGGGWLSGGTGLNKQGSAKLIFDNYGTPNDFSGTITVGGGALQIGNGDAQGNLGTGPIINNATLICDRIDTQTLSNSISGSGALNLITNGTVILSGANTFDGAVTVSAGTLVVDNNSALGSTNGSTIVKSGARLDFGGADMVQDAVNLGQESIVVSGGGPDGNGAVVNNGSVRQQNAVRLITLAGNSTFGGNSRWDIRGAGAMLSTGNQPYSLVKTQANEVVIVDALVDPALGDIDIQQGQLQFQGNTSSMGNPANTLFVRAGSSLFFNSTSNLWNKMFDLSSDSFTASVSQTGGSSTIVGPMTLDTTCVFTVANGAVSLALSNPISGSGGITLTGGTNTLILAGPAKTYTGPTYVNSGKLLVNSILSGGGGLTNNSFGIIAGTGTNSGPVEINGPLFPGDAGVIGTFTAGGLTLQGGGTVTVDFSEDPTADSGSNDFIRVQGDFTANGGSIFVNPVIGLLKTGQPYHLASYTGTLFWPGGLSVSAPNNYSFTIDTNTVGEINLIASGGPPVWNGGSSAGSMWSDSANWNGNAIFSSETLFFAGNNRVNNTNDTSEGSSYGLVFDGSAGSFGLYGNPITLSGSVTNRSSNLEKINIDMSFSSPSAFDGGLGGLIIGGNVTNTVNINALTLAGNGTLTNQFVSADPASITNVLRLGDANANWTLVDNPSSTAITNPIQFDILAGTFNFGQPGSAPVITSTTVNGAPQDQRVGTVSGAAATWNMVNGSLTTLARLNTATSGGATGIVNQVGGTLTIGNQFQGANGATNSYSFVTVSGGTLNIRDTGLHSFFVASRGPGTLTISGSGSLNCGTLDVSRSINSGIPGIVNLNGGTLAVNNVANATSSSGASTTNSTGTVNFNGGTLKANGNSATFFQGRASGPTVPLLAIVKSGGAVLDSGNNNISFLEPLQHDSTLGGTPDGGLTKNGNGTLALTASSTYTGPTLINSGTLLVNGSLSTGAVTVGASGTLGGAGIIGGAVTVNGTIAVGTSAANVGILTVQSNVTINGTASLKVDKGNLTNDMLVVSGTLTYGGVLSVTNLSGTLAANDSFKLFNAGTYSGAFSSIVPATPGLNLVWNTNQLGNGILKIDAVVTGPTTNATITRVSLSGTNLLVHGTNNNVPNTNFHYVVLTATNLATPLSNWIPMATNGFNQDGTFDYTNPVAPGTPRQFLDVRAVP